MNRGRPPKVSRADRHELRRYREAGVPVKHLAQMWHITEGTVFQILRELRAQLGPERVPESRKHLARLPIRSCEKTTSNVSGT